MSADGSGYFWLIGLAILLFLGEPDLYDALIGMSLMRIHEDLAALGYGGGYDAVRRYARTWRRRWRLLSPSHLGPSARGRPSGPMALGRVPGMGVRRHRRLARVADALSPKPIPARRYQFDWSHEYARLSGVTTKVKAAHMRLCYRRTPPLLPSRRSPSGQGTLDL